MKGEHHKKVSELIIDELNYISEGIKIGKNNFFSNSKGILLKGNNAKNVVNWFIKKCHKKCFTVKDYSKEGLEKVFKEAKEKEFSLILIEDIGKCHKSLIDCFKLIKECSVFVLGIIKKELNIILKYLLGKDKFNYCFNLDDCKPLNLEIILGYDLLEDEAFCFDFEKEGNILIIGKNKKDYGRITSNLKFQLNRLHLEGKIHFITDEKNWASTLEKIEEISNKRKKDKGKKNLKSIICLCENNNIVDNKEILEKILNISKDSEKTKIYFAICYNFFKEETLMELKKNINNVLSLKITKEKSRILFNSENASIIDKNNELIFSNEKNSIFKFCQILELV